MFTLHATTSCVHKCHNGANYRFNWLFCLIQAYLVWTWLGGPILISGILMVIIGSSQENTNNETVEYPMRDEGVKCLMQKSRLVITY